MRTQCEGNAGEERRGEEKERGEERKNGQPTLNSVFEYFTQKMGARFSEFQIKGTTEKFYHHIKDWKKWEMAADTWISREQKSESNEPTKKLTDL
jgi:hypothetical protein